MTRPTAVVLAVVLLFATAVPAAADEPYVDLVVTAELDRAAYVSSDEVGLTVSVANAGTAPATGVTLETLGEPYFQVTWDVLNPAGPGARIGPGETVRVSAAVHMRDVFDEVWQQLWVTSAEPDRDPTTDEVTLRAPLTQLRGDVSGVVYADRNGDGVVDPTEALVGVRVALGPGEGHVGRTDADGRFTFTDIPALEYWVDVDLPSGWRLTDSLRTVVIGQGDNELVLRAVRDGPLPLTAAIALDRDIYAPGDVVRERVTVTNTGAARLTGVWAVCGGMGDPNELYGLGWGELDPAGPGLTLAPGETRTFEFAEPVPERAREYGYLYISCVFTDSWDALVGPWAEARAAVPGGRGEVGATFYQDRDADGVFDDGEGVGGVEFVLMAAQAVVVRQRTDAGGRVVFATPAGRYELRVVGPWRLNPVPFKLRVRADAVEDMGGVRVFPGPWQPDPEAPPPSSASSTSPTSSTPAAAARPPVRSAGPGNLAETGADVGALSGLALLLILGGAALLLVRRRVTGKCVP